MKIATILMLTLALALSVLVILLGRVAPETGPIFALLDPTVFSERETAYFPDGPHWILRGFREQGFESLVALLPVVAFSVFCTAQALRTFFIGQKVGLLPWIAAASAFPVWIGISLILLMLRFLPPYFGQDRHDWLSAIRVDFLTCLFSGLIPAVLALTSYFWPSILLFWYSFWAPMRRHWRLIFAVTALGLLVGFIAAQLAPKIYYSRVLLEDFSY